MDRITVDQVREAYLATGCKPVRNQLHGLPGQHDGSRYDERSCCGVGSILFAKGCDPQKEDFDMEARAMFESDYLEGFYAGFDGECLSAKATNDQWLDGWQDGNAAGLAVFEERHTA